MKPTQELLTIDDLFELDIARAIEQRDFYAERIEAEVAAAKIRSAEQEKDDDARFADNMKKIDRLLQAMRRAAADPIEISQEIAARADELRRGGARTPVAQAEKEIAKQLGHASGPALNKWLRRHR